MKEAHPVGKIPLLDILLPPQKIVFIVNPHSGLRQQSRIRNSVERHLNHRLFEYGIWYTERPGHATELAAKAVAEGYEIVVAVGGDGSINEIAASLLHTEVALGIVPAGSGNGLAMHLGYGRSIDNAVKKLNTAKVQAIDCGVLNGRPFVNIAGVGFDGMVSNLMKGQTRRGLVPYFIKSVKAGLSYTSKPCVLIINGEEIRENCFAVTVANGPIFGYNVSIAPDARLDDGKFSVVILKDAPKWQYFAAVHSALNGRIFKEHFVRHFQTDQLTIKSEGDNYIHLDGEGISFAGDLHFQLLPQSLKVLMPNNAPYQSL